MQTIEGLFLLFFFNFSNRHIEIEKYSRFAQIVFQMVSNHPVVGEVENFEDNKTQRGEGPFGSTCLKKISAGKTFTNKYIPKYVPEDLTWYERDGLLTYIDQLKYKDFILTPMLKNTKIINFEMIMLNMVESLLHIPISIFRP